MGGLLPADSQYVAVAGASARFANALAEGVPYQFVSTTNCWINCTSATSVAVAATIGNIYVPANVQTNVVGPPGGLCKLAVIQDTAGGNATLTHLM